MLDQLPIQHPTREGSVSGPRRFPRARVRFETSVSSDGTRRTSMTSDDAFAKLMGLRGRAVVLAIAVIIAEDAR